MDNLFPNKDRSAAYYYQPLIPVVHTAPHFKGKKATKKKRSRQDITSTPSLPEQTQIEQKTEPPPSFSSKTTNTPTHTATSTPT